MGYPEAPEVGFEVLEVSCYGGNDGEATVVLPDFFQVLVRDSMAVEVLDEGSQPMRI